MYLFEKETRFRGYTESPHILPLDMMDYSLLKSASEMHPEIDKYIRSAKPIPGKSILLIDAMGSSEAWGPNINGDWFGEGELMHEGKDYGYQTFMHYAYPYKHHRNESRVKDPNRRYGEKVPLSVYFSPMKRVQLIAIIDKSRAGDVVDKVDAGNYPDVSMACGVAYDQCSICGSVHKTRAQYCDHAKHMLNQILSTGEQVCLKNIRPRFHDISFVFIGAEKASKVLLKVAQAGGNVAQATRGGYDLSPHLQRFGSPTSMLRDFTKKATIPKVAIIKKDIPVEKAEIVTDGKIQTIMDIKSNEEPIPSNILDMLSQFPMGDISSSLGAACMDLRPEEFQYILLKQMGEAALADQLHSAGTCFDPGNFEQVTEIPEGRTNPQIIIVISDMLPKRSGHYPFLVDRLDKRASVSTPVVKNFMKWPVVAGMYQGYLKHVPKTVQKMVTNGMDDLRPYLPAATTTAFALAGIRLGRMAAEENMFQESYLEPIFGDGISQEDWNQDSFGDIFKQSGVLDILKNPKTYGLLSAPVLYMMSSMSNAKTQADPENASFKDMAFGASPLLSTALGSYGVYRGAKHIPAIKDGLSGLVKKVGTFANKYLKKAEVIDNIVWKRINRSL